jgi:L-ascorbate metabolism protein UlaG (beta-lactamase superfamily)
MQNNKASRNSIQLIRNATLVIQYAGKKILVDPMFFPKDSFNPFAGKAKNPTVELTIPVDDIIKDVDLVLVTHTHTDHFDQVAAKVLNKSVKLINQPADAAFFQKANFSAAETVEDHTNWNGIHIYRTNGEHGSGAVLNHMDTVSGYVLKAENEPTIYVVGDSIWTDEVEQAIEKFKPDWIVTNSGGAVIPAFETTPILMDEEGTITLVKSSPEARIIAVHMESLDHCRTTRVSLRAKADQSGSSQIVGGLVC